MTFDAWLKANGYDAAQLTDSMRKHLEAAWKAETQPPPKPPADDPPARPEGDGSYHAKMEAIEKENDRLQYIRDATVLACERHRGNKEKTKQIRELGDAAQADAKVDQRAFDLSLLRLDRMVGTMILAPHVAPTNDSLLEAAVCMTHRLPNLDKQFSAPDLEAAHKAFPRGIGLQELLLVAAERNSGYRGSCRDERALCHAAFSRDGERSYYGFRADLGPSTISVPGILSNVANKFLAAGFLYTEQTCRQIARIKSTNNFQAHATYRLTGSNRFERVAPGGEIKHGTLSELTYSIKVDTYGKMLGIDRRDIINDDLGAFLSATDELGRGAGDSLNEVFWAEFVDDANFFNTDKSKGNYDDGAADSALSLAGLNNAETIFRLQTKPDGTPLGIMPAILLVPATLYNTALALMSSMGLVVGTTPESGTQINVFRGRYKVVSSVYLDAVASIGTTAWYLLADPNNVAAIELAFLRGQDTPIVETSQFDFDRLGLSMRSYMDFGCAKQEYRAAVKLKGQN